MPAAVRQLSRPAPRAATLWLSAALALTVHASGLIFWRPTPHPPLMIDVDGESLEVALVEAAPAPPAAIEPPPPEPPPPIPEPSALPPVPPEREPIAPPAPPEMLMPEAAPGTPAPKLATPRPKPVLRAPSSARPGARPSSGASALTGATNRTIGKPLYITRPSPAYPPESRAAGEQGVVLLRITVNGDGRPSAVSVARSSGFQRLDRAAVEGGWRCRLSNAVPGAQFEAPVRFSIRD